MTVRHRTTALGVGLLMLLGLGAPGGVGGAETHAERVAVEGAFVRATPPGTRVTAGYFELHHRAGGADAAVLVGAEAAFAGRVELHDHIDDDGVMRMRELTEVQVAPGDVTRFQPGGRHVMFMELEGALEPGETRRYTLEFADGSTLDVEAEVRRPGDEHHGHGGHH